MTADQYLRIWSLDVLTTQKQPCFKFHCGHPKEDGISAIAFTKDDNIMVSGDTSGQLKMWDISDVDFDREETKKHFNEKYFIIAHKSTINSI